MENATPAPANIYAEFRTICEDEFFLAGIDLLENGTIEPENRRAYAERLVRAFYPVSPVGCQITRSNFWYRMVWEKCAWKGLFDPTRAESDAKWMSDQRRWHKHNWPAKPVFQGIRDVPQIKKYK